MKTITTLFLMAVAMAATAQTPSQEPTGIEKGTLGMAKATLEFLATDQKTFPAAKKTACVDCNTYADLSTFIKDNSLKKADGLVNDIKKHSLKLNDEFAADAFTSEGAVLDSLRKYVISRVTSGPERQHRTKLASYAAYQTKMMALAGGQNPEKAVAEQAGAADEATAEAAPTDEKDTPSAGGGSTWPLWVLSALSLMGVGYLYWLLMQSGRGGGAKADTSALETQVAGLLDDNRRLNMTLAELSNRLTMVEKRQTTATRPGEPNRPADLNRPADRAQPAGGQPPMANQPRQPQQGYGPMGNNPVNPGNVPATPPTPSQQPPAQAANQPGAGVAGASALRPTPPVTPPPSQREADLAANATSPAAVPLSVTPSPAAPVPPAPQPVAAASVAPTPVVPAAPVAPTRLFARTADLGNGFSVSGLSEQAERGMVYELELTSPQTAQFRISAAPEAQQVAMSDPYSYLSDACLYENQPNMQSGTVRIQTLTPGQLTLVGDKWQITEKARIGFV
ncbi:hypothetical protein [Fibrella aquatilis]|uniref:Uncharacterized protein n=1 Tax=Fibrella aquatilis TaxID=2817059 RepID=A0A939G7A4_9BACT|nr:hypothetical protein [Fibrella aquatilis]MBO0933514.1 hypothetical protein [Fibrella aquatilis]